MRRGRQGRNFQLSKLGPQALEQVRQAIGDAHLQKLLKKEPVMRTGARYKVCPPEERTVDGIVFDSGWESEVYTELKKWSIPFTLQPRFLLQAGQMVEGKKVRATYYVADFLFGPTRVGEDSPLTPQHVVVDAKGHLTDVYRLKAKMFSACYGHAIVEVKTMSDLRKLRERLQNAKPSPPSIPDSRLGG